MSRPWIRSVSTAIAVAVVVAGGTAVGAAAEPSIGSRAFNRVATFHVDDNAGSAVAEIVTATEDGRTLLYTDAGARLVGFVDISNAERPTASGTIATGGSPTSVAVVKGHALVAVDDTPTEPDGTFGAHDGRLLVIDIGSRSVVRTFDLGGQPDSIKVTHNHQYAVIAIENQRDEEVADGVMPHTPTNGAERDEPGWVTIIDLKGPVAGWSSRAVMLEGLPGMLYAEDPEPEFVDTNATGQAVVTLQENNHVAVLDLKSATVVKHWSAGAVSGQVADTSESPSDIVFSGAVSVPREPDSIVFLDNKRVATADEGDYDGGSRSFTIFDLDGNVLSSVGTELELKAVRHGHYVEDRSANKGVEPEGITSGKFNGSDYIFVGLERANAVAVYLDASTPRFAQLLPTGVEPEGLLPLPKRNLFVVASEGDGTITIFRHEKARATYPTIVSEQSATKGAVPGTTSPIAWGALSALASHPTTPGLLYTVHDNVHANSRIYTLDATAEPARIVGVLDLTPGPSGNESWDVEGIAVRPAPAGGGFWLASEGSNVPGDPAVTRLNHLLAVNPAGVVTAEVPLPAIAGATPTSNGFEGIAAVWNSALAREEVFVAVQRSWDGTNWTRIARYLPETDEWAFVAYPLDAGNNVGLSELVAVGPSEFAVIERDNRGGRLAAVKRIYRFSIAGVAWTAIGDSTDPALVTKTLVDDLLDDLAAPRGDIIEKVEGLAVDAAGQTFLNTDNDGEDGESQFFRLGSWSDLVN
jgi:hypothetical protein